MLVCVCIIQYWDQERVHYKQVLTILQRSQQTFNFLLIPKIFCSNIFTAPIFFFTRHVLSTSVFRTDWFNCIHYDWFNCIHYDWFNCIHYEGCLTVDSTCSYFLSCLLQLETKVYANKFSLKTSISVIKYPASNYYT